MSINRNTIEYNANNQQATFKIIIYYMPQKRVPVNTGQRKRKLPVHYGCHSNKRNATISS